ncbi:DUF6183 family protein [Kitasatospora sp. NPDC088134]|uniref:DUF6183 family protein n=1 Tax=Kitasatospora sp. NPDC088134 TaxID=3364071 RepID=UPI0038064691
MDDRLRDLLAKLPRLTSVSAVDGLAADLLAAGAAEAVLGFGLAVAGRAGDPRVWQYRAAFDSVFGLLAAAPGAENAERALRLLSALPPGDRRELRRRVSVLAADRPVEELASAFAEPAPEELRAFLARELRLRGTDLSTVPLLAARAAVEQPAYQQCPFGLAAADDLPELPPYPGAEPGAGGLAIVPSGAELPPLAKASGHAAREVTAPDDFTALGAATAGWAAGSNGRTEARVFALPAPLEPDTPEALRILLPSLGLDCLRDRNDRSGLAVRATDATAVWELLFAVALHGGAYSSGVDGARARLVAWQSLSALADCPRSADLAAIERRAERCAWFAFEAATGWFDQVAWDLGLLALSPDRTRLAVLAATDTD